MHIHKCIYIDIFLYEHVCLYNLYVFIHNFSYLYTGNLNTTNWGPIFEQMCNWQEQVGYLYFHMYINIKMYEKTVFTHVYVYIYLYRHISKCDICMPIFLHV
jgi:hypothetical protein